jgi:hypothetical protein
VLLRGALRSRDAGLIRPGIERWLKVVIVWQALVVVGSATYVAVLASAHTRGYAWVAPAVGAVFGTAVPLQFAVIAILRASRGS